MSNIDASKAGAKKLPNMKKVCDDICSHMLYDTINTIYVFLLKTHPSSPHFFPHEFLMIQYSPCTGSVP